MALRAFQSQLLTVDGDSHGGGRKTGALVGKANKHSWGKDKQNRKPLEKKERKEIPYFSLAGEGIMPPHGLESIFLAAQAHRPTH